MDAIEQPSVRDSLAAAIAAVPAEPEAPVVENTVAIEPAAPVVDTRARDAAGKFTNPAEPTEPVTTAPAAAPQASSPAGPSAAAPADAAPVAAIPRPQAWTKKLQPQWDKIVAGQPLSAEESRKVAEYVVKREEQAYSVIRSAREEARPLMEALAPFREDMQKYGVQAPDMVRNLMGAHRTLALGAPQEKLALFNKLAQDYGIPMQALYDPTAQQQFLNSAPRQQAPQQPAIDPATLKAQIKTEMAIESEIAKIESNPKDYPYFQYLRSTMAEYIGNGTAQDMHEAYQQALEAPQHAGLAAAMHSQQAREQEQQRIAAAAAHVKVAKANAVSPRSATPASNGTVNGKSTVRGALEEAMATHIGGGRV